MNIDSKPQHLMNPIVFRLIRNFIYKHSGLWFDDNKLHFVQNRLSKRLKALELHSFHRYYYYLLYDRNSQRELNEIIDSLTTNETYFFREKNQLQAFSEEILPRLREEKKADPQPGVNIWSAGCSTGEEPYTIAMLIMESRLFPGWDINITATDISSRVLSVGRRGIYSRSSFRAANAYFINKYFSHQDYGFRINDDVKRLVNFARINLLDRKRMDLIRDIDVLFCRNVVIYFDLAAKRKVMDAFYDCLKPGGFLLLGHAESLVNVSTKFDLTHLQHDLVYQKPDVQL